MDRLTIRTAAPEDAPGLLEIYRPYVEETTVTFEYRVPSPEEFAGRIRRTLERYPYLAAEVDGELAGYAYASPFQTRAAYGWAAETSIYVKREYQGRGVGRALYEALEEALKRQHVQNLNACITYPNPDSVTFHEKLGYVTVAHFHKCGYKLGQWLDMIWMEKFLGGHESEPEPVIPFREAAFRPGAGKEEQAGKRGAPSPENTDRDLQEEEHYG